MEKTERQFIISRDQLSKVVDFFLSICSKNSVVFLKGELGSGKTTFVKEVARKIKITDHVTSPTFLIHKDYNFDKNKKLHHYDLYRLSSYNELAEIGFEEFLLEEGFNFIEWPEKIRDLNSKIPDGIKLIEICFHHQEYENKRKIVVKYEK